MVRAMMIRHPRKMAMLLAASLVLAAFGAFQHVRGSKPVDALTGATAVTVTARALPLDPGDPARHTVGALGYIAGWVLTADNAHFGGFSGLVARADGRLTAISDRGDWLDARLDLTAKTPLYDAVMRPFSAETRSLGKAALDAESVIAFGDGFLVAFEGRHRVMAVAPDGTAQPSALTANMDFAGMASNRGLEAITLVDGKLLALPEFGVDVEGRLHGWLGDAQASTPVYFKPPVNYSPTDAATMKNGDVLLLLRRYSPLDGVSAKLVRIRHADIMPGATLVGEELMHLEPPQSVDNMEGLDVIERKGQKPVIVLISDDNFRSSQRTLLLAFSLERL